MIFKNFKFHFYLKRTKNYVSGMLPIYLRITINGERKELCTMLGCDAKNWLKHAECTDGKTQLNKEINHQLTVIKFKIMEYKTQALIDKKFISPESVVRMLSSTKEPEKYILEVFQKHNDRMETLVGKDFAPGTLERYKTVLKHTKAFIQWKYNFTDLPVDQLDFDFVNDYEYWLKTEQKCCHNTSIKYVANFRKIVSYCIKAGWIAKDPFLGYSMKRKEVPVIPLTAHELEKIKNKEFSIERLTHVKDIFLFCCYTGLSYIDVYNLKPSDIVIGTDKRKWIYSKRAKTTSTVKIPLLPDALEIINRYAAHKRCIETNKLLPVLSNQKMNAYLVEIADVCYIEKKITMHIARHTFATTITLNNGVPMETVSKMLGHSHLKTTQHYAKLQDEKIGYDMNQLSKIIN